MTNRLKILTRILFVSLLGYHLALPQTELAQIFKSQYHPFCQLPLTELRLENIQTALQDLNRRFPASFSFYQIGSSVQNRPIYLVELGHGQTTVLLWSQMHGDEPTATAALLDIFNFLLENQNTPLVRQILDSLRILAVPMLNPDGAAANTRRNAQGLDINRDARDLTTPEGQLLYQLQQKYHPVFGFNLHDQNGRITTARTNRQVALALMAPPFDYEGSDNATRLRAKKLVVWLTKTLEPLIGGHIARYSDEYMPRAFGDSMQRWDVSTVLIESGGWSVERDRFLQEMNFVAILTALSAIANRFYEESDPASYDALPLNDKELFDLVISDVMVIDGTGIPPFKTDVAINCQIEDADTVGVIADLGDLNEFAARDTINGSGLLLMPGMLAVIPITTLQTRDYSSSLRALLSQGFTTVLVTFTPRQYSTQRKFLKQLNKDAFVGNLELVVELDRDLRTAADSLQVLDILHRGAIGTLTKDTLQRGFGLAEWVGKPAVALPVNTRLNQLTRPDPVAIKTLTADRFEQWRISRRGKIRIGQVADGVLFEIDQKGKMHIKQVLIKGFPVNDK